MQYSGAKKTHGNNHQGLETPDGMIIEMHGPFEGPYNDQRMYRESGLNARLMLYCAILTLVDDRNSSHELRVYTATRPLSTSKYRHPIWLDISITPSYRQRGCSGPLFAAITATWYVLCHMDDAG